MVAARGLAFMAPVGSGRSARRSRLYPRRGWAAPRRVACVGTRRRGQWVTAYQPDTLLAFETIAGPVRPTGEFRLQEAGGATTLTLAHQADLAGVKRLFISGMVQKTMDAEVAVIDNVKRLLEP